LPEKSEKGRMGATRERPQATFMETGGETHRFKGEGTERSMTERRGGGGKVIWGGGYRVPERKKQKKVKISGQGPKEGSMPWSVKFKVL